MPLKRSPAATIYEVGLTRKRKGEGAGGRERGRERKRRIKKRKAIQIGPPLEEPRFISLGFLASVPKGISIQNYIMFSFYLLLAGYGGNTSQTYAYRKSETRKEKEGRKAGR